MNGFKFFTRYLTWIVSINQSQIWGHYSNPSRIWALHNVTRLIDEKYLNRNSWFITAATVRSTTGPCQMRSLDSTSLNEPLTHWVSYNLSKTLPEKIQQIYVVYVGQMVNNIGPKMEPCGIYQTKVKSCSASTFLNHKTESWIAY